MRTYHYHVAVNGVTPSWAWIRTRRQDAESLRVKMGDKRGSARTRMFRGLLTIASCDDGDCQVYRDYLRHDAEITRQTS